MIKSLKALIRPFYNRFQKLKAHVAEIHRVQKDDIAALKDRMVFVGYLGAGVILFDFVTIALIYPVRSQSYSVQALLLGLIVSACFIFVVRRRSHVFSLKLSAFLYITYFLLMLAWGGNVDGSAYPEFLIGYVITLLTSSLIIPWSPFEVLGISMVNIAVFSIHFYHGKGLIQNAPGAYGSNTDYMAGVAVLFMSLLMAMSIRRFETHVAIDKYRLNKQLKEKNRQMQSELELATRVHRRLIPHSVDTNLAEIAVTYVPMYYMGGDYARFHFVDKRRLIFIICDVTGHGVSAALLVNSFNTEFERLAKEGMEPGKLLKELDRFINRNFAETNMFLTAFCGLLDYGRMKFVYSSYGHPPQYIYRAAEAKAEKINSQTSFLGLPLAGDEVYQNELPFAQKDQILLFTDGVLEARDPNGEDFGDRRLEDIVARNGGVRAESFNEMLLDKLNSFTGNKLRDDVFILNILTK